MSDKKNNVNYGMFEWGLQVDISKENLKGSRIADNFANWLCRKKSSLM
jgi:hypothetical protein